jgi:hypothetical protein
LPDLKASRTDYCGRSHVTDQQNYLPESGEMFSTSRVFLAFTTWISEQKCCLSSSAL